MKKRFPLLPLLLLGACMSTNTSSGIRVDAETLSHFHKGQTTYGEVVQAIGQPNNISTMADGSKMAMYISTNIHHDMNPLAPFVGSAASMDQSSVTLMFDRNDILKYYTTSQNNYGGGTAGLSLR